MLWSEVHLASHFRLLESDLDWMTLVATWPSSISELFAEHGPGGWSTRTSPVFFPAKEETTSPPSCPPQADGASTRPETGGETAASFLSEPAKITGSPIECLTLNTLEYHNDAVASSLSDILETGDVPQRFYLSAKACQGILRRAEKRGRSLPRHLLEALEAGVLTPPEPKPII